jgi:hypothetical protein
MKAIWVLSGLMIFGAGCVPSSVETTRLNTAPRPLVARPARSVEIYTSSPPTRPHVDVALLRADHADYGADTRRMLQMLAEKAGELGCDALYISGASHRASVTGDLSLLDPGSHILIGTCIAYLPQSPAEALALSNPSSTPPAANALVLLPPEERKPARYSSGTEPGTNGQQMIEGQGSARR